MPGVTGGVFPMRLFGATVLAGLGLGVAVLATASPAFAIPVPGPGAGGGSAQVQITGTIPATCSFTTLPANPNLGVLTTGAVINTGNLGFTCNMATTGPVTLTVQSANGALKRDGGTE